MCEKVREGSGLVEKWGRRGEKGDKMKGRQFNGKGY